MALTYAQIKTALDTTWTGRVEASLTAAAIAISVDAPSTPLDARRDRLAREIIRNPSAFATLFALPVALGFLSGNDLATVTDAQLDARVSAVFNDFLL